MDNIFEKKVGVVVSKIPEPNLSINTGDPVFSNDEIFAATYPLGSIKFDVDKIILRISSISGNEFILDYPSIDSIEYIGNGLYQGSIIIHHHNPNVYKFVYVAGNNGSKFYIELANVAKLNDLPLNFIPLKKGDVNNFIDNATKWMPKIVTTFFIVFFLVIATIILIVSRFLNLI